MLIPNDLQIRDIVKNALAEDIGSGDITTALTVPSDTLAAAYILAKEDGVICGLDLVRLVYEILDPRVEFHPMVADGVRVSAPRQVAMLDGPAQSLLTGERIALNFLQHLSGISTRTAAFVKLAAGTKARIVDTRKTTPGLRILEKYAVRVGGGYNHRFGLDDGILIKDNHITAAGGVIPAVKAAKQNAPHTLKVEVEAKLIEQVHEALAAGADTILLDNMGLEQIKQAVELVGGQAVIEVSGGVTEATVAAFASAGVDIISAGALTHSVKALDLSMEITGETAAKA